MPQQVCSYERTSSYSGIPIFHSKPGSPNAIFLDFDGHEVSNTAWNDQYKSNYYSALPFSIDASFGKFSQQEMDSIAYIWTRVSEDYSPFDVDVTTEPPSSMGLQVGHVVVTRGTDRYGTEMPSGISGGLAFMNVFGSKNYPFVYLLTSEINNTPRLLAHSRKYRPAFVYYSNLAMREDFIAEACSHEMGHNLGMLPLFLCSSVSSNSHPAPREG